MSTKITERDNGAKALLARMKAARGVHGVTVGIHEQEGSQSHGDGTTVLDVAVFHEFGTEHLNARHPFSGWYDSTERENAKKLKAIAEGLVTGRTQDADRALDAFGAQSAAELRDFMGHVPSLEPDDPTPLDDTGKLKAAVTHQVKR